MTEKMERDDRAFSEPGPHLVVGLNAVIIALTNEQPRVLTVSIPEDTPIEGGGATGAEDEPRVVEALPTGPLDPAGDRTLELALRRWVRKYAGIDLGYVEQLYTFGDRYRDPRERSGGSRVISAAYLALIRESPPTSDRSARWRSIYTFFPWEDWRNGRPEVVDVTILPALDRWIGRTTDRQERALRHERASIAFGTGTAQWDGERVLDRYELLYEIGLVTEAARNTGRGTQQTRSMGAQTDLGRGMAFDHRRILATAVGRIRAKIRYRPVVFELMPESFTLLQLQRAVEALAGVGLHKQNFRRLVAQGGLVEEAGGFSTQTGGRPAKLFRFRREVLLERPAPGVGLPGAPR